MILKFTKYTLLISILCILSQTASAQKSKEEKYYINNEKKWLIEVPIWVPGFRGQFTLGEVILSSSGNKKERDFERLNSDLGLELYFLTKIAVRYNKLWFQLDAFSGRIGSAFSFERIKNNTEKSLLKVSIHSTMVRFTFGYTLFDKTSEKGLNINLTPYLGVRLFDTQIDSQVLDSFFISKARPNWLEPTVGIFIPISFKRFQLNLQSDIGGISSKLSWIINSQINYSISKLIDVKIGWTYIDIEHKSTINDKELDLDIVLSGPIAGIGFRF